jgi:hypothetical protein
MQTALRNTNGLQEYTDVPAISYIRMATVWPLRV